MSGKCIHILNNYGFHLFPGGTANAPAFFNPGAGNWSLKRAQHEFIFFYQIESDPKPFELLF